VNMYVTTFICINVSGHNTLVNGKNSMHALLSGFSPEHIYVHTCEYTCITLCIHICVKTNALVDDTNLMRALLSEASR